MRLFSICDDNSTGAYHAPTFSRFLMYVFITSTIILTVSQGNDAASINSLTRRHRHRSKSRTIRDAQGSGELKESLGERECTEDEKQTQGCLAGSCAALVTSQLHTFIICRCPSDRQGPRCEEVAINTDSIAAILMEQTQEELCKQERYDIMAKSLGYDSVFFDCVNKNYKLGILDDSSSSEKLSKKQRKREQLKKERERARKRKMRKRQRKRSKKRGMRSSEKSSIDDIKTRNGFVPSHSNTPDHISDLILTEREFRKKMKDHTGHNHNKIRHESEKSLTRRRRKSVTTFLKGTSSVPDVTTHPPNPNIIH